MMRMHHKATPGLPCACAELRKASRAVTRIYDASLSAAGMTSSQFSILWAIRQDGARPLSRLAEAMVMDRTSLYRALAPLVRSDWVVIENGASGRTKIVSLTDEGRHVTDAAFVHWQAAQTRFVEALGVETWASLHKSIANLAEVGMAVGP